jgi:hypothetical protein
MRPSSHRSGKNNRQTYHFSGRYFQEVFSAVSSRVGELRDILWVNPVNEDETPIQWLKDGAPNEERRQLRP